MSAEFVLLPVPRRLELREGEGAPADAAVTTSVDPGLPAQGYRLVVGDGAIALQHADDAGRRYGE